MADDRCTKNSKVINYVAVFLIIFFENNIRMASGNVHRSNAPDRNWESCDFRDQMEWVLKITVRNSRAAHRNK